MFPQFEYNSATFGTIINQCVNLELKQKFTLMGYSYIEMCFNKFDKFQPDLWDAIFFFITSAIFKMVVAGSWFDFKRKQAQQRKEKITNKEYFQAPVESRIYQLSSSFSLMRNWYKFVKLPENDEFNSISTLKVFLTFTVICGHINSVFKGFPSDNTYFLEENSNSIWAPMFMNSHITIQSFLTSAAFLTGYQFMKYQNHRHKSAGIDFIWKAIVYRILRYELL